LLSTNLPWRPAPRATVQSIERLNVTEASGLRDRGYGPVTIRDASLGTIKP